MVVERTHPMTFNSPFHDVIGIAAVTSVQTGEMRVAITQAIVVGRMKLQTVREGPGSQCLSPLRCLNLDDNERHDGHKDDQEDKERLAQTQPLQTWACTLSLRISGLSKGCCYRVLPAHPGGPYFVNTELISVLTGLAAGPSHFV